MPTELKRGLLFSAMLLVVLIGASLAANALWSRMQTPARSGTYAVFLNGGQVYFGTIAEENEHRLVLKKIYYIQYKNGQASALADQSDVALLKLGNELHGPEDWMEINRDAIIFIERLKPDGKVAKAIEAYQQK